LLQGRNEEAEKMLAAAGTELPGLSRVWFNQGLLAESRGERERMIRSYNLSSEIDRRDPAPAIQLGDYYYGEYQRTTWKNEFTAHLLEDAAVEYERGLYNWLTAYSSHAGRVQMLYHSRSHPMDDAIPNGFLHYLRPQVDVAQVSTRLAEIHRQRGNQQLAEHFEEVGKQAIH
jgi:hypothetical protein